MNAKMVTRLACLSLLFLSYRVFATSVQQTLGFKGLASLAATTSFDTSEQNRLLFAESPYSEPNRILHSLFRQSGSRKQCESDSGVLGIFKNCAQSCLLDKLCSSSCCLTTPKAKQYSMCQIPGCCVRIVVYADGIAVLGEQASPSGTVQGICSGIESKTSCENCFFLLNYDDKFVTCSSYNVPSEDEDVSATNLCGTSSSPSNGSGATPTPDGGTTGESGRGTRTDTGSGSPSPGTTPSPLPATGKDGCFPSTAIVKLESGEKKYMRELKLGDRVQVGPATFSDVFAFTHRVSEALTEFYSIRTESGHALFISPGHYLHTVDGLVTAGAVSIGQNVILGSGAVTTVVSKKMEILKGLYNPQTLDGSIVVDGILASTYTTAVSPELAHLSLAPLRAVYNWFGVTTSLLDSGAEKLARLSPRGLETF